MQNKLFYFIVLLISLSSCGKTIADFTYKGADKPAPADVEFENNSQKADSYEWDFGDGSTSTEISPKHDYKSSGNYTVLLKAKKGKREAQMSKKVFIEGPKDCLVEIQTAYGNMVVKLYNETPQHRDNFIKLVEDGFYDGLLFHRVMDGFMIQGGDPRSRNARPGQSLGSGGPGYQIPAEFVDSLVHIKGAIAAARTSDAVNPERKSSGSQFYIVQGQPLSEASINNFEERKGIKYSEEQRQILQEQGGTPFLDKDYTVFGQVIEGLDIIDKIGNVKTAPGDRPLEDVKMTIKLIN